TLQSQGMVSGNTYFFEGDDQATIDGRLAAHGTGSEDFFNGGWYDAPGRWYDRASYPLSGCLDYKKVLGRTGAYRLFLTDAYAFNRSMLLTIEHGPEKNRLPTDYVGVTYLYADSRPSAPSTLPTVAERTVRDPEHLIFTPGWNVPLYAFSLERATITKKDERIGDQGVRYFSMRAEGQDAFGPHNVAFNCDLPAAGRYRISIEAVQGPEQGIVQLFRDEAAVGEAVDLYAPERRKTRVIPMGMMEFKAGENPVFFKLIGKNADAKALGLDLVTIHFERVP
ncbi:MAG TPA: DUF2961 domain-containing protein, partial [Armatimonadota bacterium]|nr:DUF2961 domain-containing protein [Armatimonadota bacterium]